MTTRRNFLKSLTAAPLTLPLAGPARAAAPSRPFPAADGPAFWSAVRDEFLLARDKTFFNTGTMGAMPRVVVEAVTRHLTQCAVDAADWDYRGADWIAGYQPQTEIRAKAARLINADVRELGLTENATVAMSLLAAGLDLDPGDEVLTSDQEHGGGQGPWQLKAQRAKTVFRTMALPKPAHDPGEIVDIVRKSLTPKTRVLMLSHIITGSGAVLPVREICAEARTRGIFTIVDGAQAVGHVPVDVRAIGCDAYVGCFHKWILAPAGTGFLYVRHEKMKDVWSTLASGSWNNHEDDGHRFGQRGTNSLSLLRGLDAALDFHFRLGPARVQARIKELGDQLRRGLKALPKVRIFSPADPDMCAGITVWTIEGWTGPRLQDELWNRGRLRPRSMGDVYGVRQSTHIYNSPEEIDRTLVIARTLAGA